MVEEDVLEGRTLHRHLQNPERPRGFDQIHQALGTVGHGDAQGIAVGGLLAHDLAHAVHPLQAGGGVTILRELQAHHVASELGLAKTLLGVDVVLDRKLLATDVNEAQLLDLLDGKPPEGPLEAKIIVTPIGGQGYLFGRGNQQISDQVIQRVGRENIIVIATKSKLFALGGSPLLVDTGNDEVNQMLSGYVRVTTGRKERLMYKVSC